jgi:hypothetical protein
MPRQFTAEEIRHYEDTGQYTADAEGLRSLLPDLERIATVLPAAGQAAAAIRQGLASPDQRKLINQTRAAIGWLSPLNRFSPVVQAMSNAIKHHSFPPPDDDWDDFP